MQKHTAASIGKNNPSRKTTSVASKNKALASLKVNIGSFIKVGERVSTMSVRYHMHWDSQSAKLNQSRREKK